MPRYEGSLAVCLRGGLHCYQSKLAISRLRIISSSQHRNLHSHSSAVVGRGGDGKEDRRSGCIGSQGSNPSICKRSRTTASPDEGISPGLSISYGDQYGVLLGKIAQLSNLGIPKIVHRCKRRRVLCINPGLPGTRRAVCRWGGLIDAFHPTTQ
jgi:hypothetical protein